MGPKWRKNTISWRCGRSDAHTKGRIRDDIDPNIGRRQHVDRKMEGTAKTGRQQHVGRKTKELQPLPGKIGFKVYELGHLKRSAFLTIPPFVLRCAQLLLVLADEMNLQSLYPRELRQLVRHKKY
jgi:hypothetical protein